MDKNIFNNEIKREGWDKMKTILDNEMPVRKRRLLPFFLVFLAIGIAGIALLYSEISNKGQKEMITKGNAPVNNQINTQKFEIKETAIDTFSKETLNTEKQKTNTGEIQNRNKIKKSIIQKNNKLDKKQYDLIAISDKDKTPNNKDNIILEKQLTIENNIVLINKRATVGLLSFLIEQKNIMPEFDFNDLVINRKKRAHFINPYIGAKIHTYNYKEFSPKYEFDLGTYFKITGRFSFGIGIAFTQRDLIYQEIQEKNYVVLNNGIDKNANRVNYELKNPDQSKWLFEIMLKEKYNINRKLALDLGGGIVLGGTKFLKKDLAAADSSEFNYEYNPDNYKPVIFGDLGIYYSLTNKINAGIGYKYYYSGTYKVNEANTEVYSQKLVNKKYSSRLYLGINYYF